MYEHTVYMCDACGNRNAYALIACISLQLLPVCLPQNIAKKTKRSRPSNLKELLLLAVNRMMFPGVSLPHFLMGGVWVESGRGHIKIIIKECMGLGIHVRVALLL